MNEPVLHANCVITAIKWDSPLHGNVINFTDENAQRHVLISPFDPHIFHHSNPTGRLLRWMLQPGAKADLLLPQTGRETPQITILEYSELQYVSGVYTNHEGRTETRSIVPIRVSLEATPYHGLQYTLTAWCRDRKALRSFALSDFDFASAKADAFTTHPMSDI